MPLLTHALLTLLACSVARGQDGGGGDDLTQMTPPFATVTGINKVPDGATVRKLEQHTRDTALACAQVCQTRQLCDFAAWYGDKQGFTGDNCVLLQASAEAGACDDLDDVEPADGVSLLVKQGDHPCGNLAELLNDLKDTSDDEPGDVDAGGDGGADDEEDERLLDYDTDADGTPDWQDDDDDGDGTLDAEDTDDDNDGIPDEDEDPNDGFDADRDGAPDWQDADDDNDGTTDVQDDDDDGDGIPDADEPMGDYDTDGDGMLDSEDDDDDGDGMLDYQDADDDDDGIPDDQEEPFDEDADDDGTPDWDDADDDNDGRLDEQDYDDDGDDTPDAQERDGARRAAQNSRRVEAAESSAGAVTATALAAVAALCVMAL